MGKITIFISQGQPIGTCPSGEEKQFLNSGKKLGHLPDDLTQKSSTDERWYAYARHRANNWPGDPNFEMIQQEALKLL